MTIIITCTTFTVPTAKSAGSNWQMITHCGKNTREAGLPFPSLEGCLVWVVAPQTCAHTPSLPSSLPRSPLHSWKQNLWGVCVDWQAALSKRLGRAELNTGCLQRGCRHLMSPYPMHAISPHSCFKWRNRTFCILITDYITNRPIYSTLAL